MSRRASPRRPLPRPSTKSEQTEVTTRRLLEVARGLFATKGYAGTSVAEIVETAGVTKGALYHHFPTKEALFLAVFEQLQQEISERIEARAATDAWTDVVDGCITYLRTVAEPEFRQIVILDAPAVLGLAAWRAADERSSMHLLRTALARICAEQALAHLSVSALTVLINGAINEAANWVAQADEREQALKQASDAFVHLLTSLRRGSTAPPEPRPRAPRPGR